MFCEADERQPRDCSRRKETLFVVRDFQRLQNQTLLTMTGRSSKTKFVCFPTVTPAT
jgi:hypothetical protein